MEIIKQILKFKSRELITPHFIRITLTGDVKEYEACNLGANNKLLIPVNNGKKVVLPQDGVQIDPEKLDVRTYTHRGIDLEKNEMIIDFVNHGDNGPASRWASNAEVGDEIGVAMKSKRSALFPEADWYFLIGDATAIPVLSVILETLPPQAKGKVILEVHSKEDEQSLSKPEGIEIQWLYNSTPEKGSELAKTARTVVLPKACTYFAYVAAEFDTVKNLRIYFRKELNWTKDQLNAFSYWKSGVAENQSVKARHDEREAMNNK